MRATIWNQLAAAPAPSAPGRQAERAHVHRNTPTSRPGAPQLQKYLQDMIRVLTAAAEMTGDAERAAFLLRNEPLRAFQPEYSARAIDPIERGTFSGFAELRATFACSLARNGRR